MGRIPISLGVHLRDISIPSIHEILMDISNEYDNIDPIMSWEKRRDLTRQGVVLLPVTGSEYGMPLVAAVSCIAIYYALIGQKPNLVLDIDQPLIIINGVLLLYSIFIRLPGVYYIDKKMMDYFQGRRTINKRRVRNESSNPANPSI
jgi:hypothetical protein